MRVLVTGGSGFLGSHVVERLLAQKHEVVCLVRKSSNTKLLTELGVSLAVGAVDEPETLGAAVDGCDAVIHCAGLVKARTQQEFDRVHVGGTCALAKAAIARAPHLRRFVHVSTAAVMGPGKQGVKHRAGDPENPQTLYAKSKLAAERALLEFTKELPITIIRPPAIYGPRDSEVLAFFKMVRRIRMAFRMGNALQSVSMVFGSDCADACVRAIDGTAPSGVIYFVDDGVTHSFEDMSRAIAAGYGIDLLAIPRLPPGLIRAAAAVSSAYGDAFDQAVMFNTDKLGELLMEHFVVDSSPVRTDLDWSSKVTFADGARITAKWYREQGWD
jgi:nucleoside-diphosphate-sugar epimerase